MVAAKSSPDPPVRLTMVCRLTASMVFTSSAGGTPGFCARRRETCVWKSMTGKRARGTGVSHVQHALWLELGQPERKALLSWLC